MKSEIRRHGRGWVARWNPGQGMWTLAQYARTWDEAWAWLAEQYRLLGRPGNDSNDWY